MKGKQWLLDQFNKVKERYEGEYNEKSILSTGKFALLVKIECLDYLTNIINELDEPVKPTVPQFIADYIEWYNEQDITTRNQEVMVHEFIHPVMSDYPQKDKVVEYGSKYAFKMLEALLNGYTVEKEPKYIIHFPDSKIGTPAYGNIVTMMGKKVMGTAYGSPGVKIRPNKYTAEEINEVGERYWEFAENVED